MGDPTILLYRAVRHLHSSGRSPGGSSKTKELPAEPVQARPGEVLAGAEWHKSMTKYDVITAFRIAFTFKNLDMASGPFLERTLSGNRTSLCSLKEINVIHPPRLAL